MAEKARKRFQFSLKVAIAFFVALSIFTGIAIVGIPYYLAWNDVNTFLREMPDDADESVIAYHFRDMGDIGLWAMRRAFRDPDPDLRRNAVSIALYMGESGLPLVPDLAIVFLEDSSEVVRESAEESIGYLLRGRGGARYLREIRASGRPNRDKAEQVLLKHLQAEHDGSVGEPSGL